MTPRTGGPRRAVPRAWVLPVLALVLLLVAVYLGLLSRSVVFDLIAWWPLWLILLTLVFLARGRRWGRVRVSALVPIVWLTVFALFLSGHLLGWALMPSASTDLNGPPGGSVTTAALSARIDGRLRIGSGVSGFLYAVEPLKRGGEIGPPVAVEQLQGANIAIDLDDSPDPGLYTFAGWAIDLDESPVWSLSLGGEIEANLSRLDISSLQLDGEGTATLGPADGNVVVTVSGDFELVVPHGVPARVVGQAVVPTGWTEVGDGHESPTPGPGWVISVGRQASLTVTEG
ncbi:MAG TPA: hypothetical protein VK990_07550 [Acidimicrobiia bacterium]|nr:hypothetical protein [Acidimicrobiia bacterium]